MFLICSVDIIIRDKAGKDKRSVMRPSEISIYCKVHR